MDINQVVNAKASSINIDMLNSSKEILSENGYKNLISIFNEIDNSELDDDNTKGSIKGENAISKFYAKVKALFKYSWNVLLSNVNSSNEEQFPNAEKIGSGGNNYCSYSVYQNEDGSYFAKYDDGQILKLKSENKEDAISEASDFMNQKIKDDEDAETEVKNNAPKPYTYRGVKITVQEVKFNMDGSKLTELKYNYCVSMLGSINASTSKEKIEQWIDKKIQWAEDNNIDLGTQN